MRGISTRHAVWLLAVGALFYSVPLFLEEVAGDNAAAELLMALCIPLGALLILLAVAIFGLSFMFAHAQPERIELERDPQLLDRILKVRGWHCESGPGTARLSKRPGRRLLEALGLLLALSAGTVWFSSALPSPAGLPVAAALLIFGIRRTWRLRRPVAVTLEDGTASFRFLGRTKSHPAGDVEFLVAVRRVGVVVAYRQEVWLVALVAGEKIDLLGGVGLWSLLVPLLQQKLEATRNGQGVDQVKM